MPDLGKYSFHVLSAYGVTLAALAALVALTWLRSRAVRRKLAEAEARSKAAAGGTHG